MTAVTSGCRNRTLLSQIWNGKIGYRIWYEKYAAVKCKWLWQVYTIILDVCSVDICCDVTELYAALVSGVLWDFEEINFYIFSHSFIEHLFCI